MSLFFIVYSWILSGQTSYFKFILMSLDVWIQISLCPSYSPIAPTPFMVFWGPIQGPPLSYTIFQKVLVSSWTFSELSSYLMPTSLLDCKLHEHEPCVFLALPVSPELRTCLDMAGAQYIFAMFKNVYEILRECSLFPTNRFKDDFIF